MTGDVNRRSVVVLIAPVRTIVSHPILLGLAVLPPFLVLLFPVLLFRFPGRLRRRHDRPATLRRSASADIQLLVVVGMLRSPLIRVVVRQFDAGGNVLQRRDEHATVFLFDRLAVRIAGVIDVLRRPVDRTSVEHAIAVTDREEKGVMTSHFVIGIPEIGFVLFDAFAEVFDDACALRDASGRECTFALNL